MGANSSRKLSTATTVGIVEGPTFEVPPVPPKHPTPDSNHSVYNVVVPSVQVRDLVSVSTPEPDPSETPRAETYNEEAESEHTTSSHRRQGSGFPAPLSVLDSTPKKQRQYFRHTRQSPDVTPTIWPSDVSSEGSKQQQLNGTRRHKRKIPIGGSPTDHVVRQMSRTPQLVLPTSKVEFTASADMHWHCPGCGCKNEMLFRRCVLCGEMKTSGTPPLITPSTTTTTSGPLRVPSSSPSPTFEVKRTPKAEGRSPREQTQLPIRAAPPMDQPRNSDSQPNGIPVADDSPHLLDKPETDSEPLTDAVPHGKITALAAQPVKQFSHRRSPKALIMSHSPRSPNSIHSSPRQATPGSSHASPRLLDSLDEQQPSESGWECPRCHYVNCLDNVTCQACDVIGPLSDKPNYYTRHTGPKEDKPQQPSQQETRPESPSSKYSQKYLGHTRQRSKSMGSPSQPWHRTTKPRDKAHKGKRRNSNANSPKTPDLPIEIFTSGKTHPLLPPTPSTPPNGNYTSSTERKSGLGARPTSLRGRGSGEGRLDPDDKDTARARVRVVAGSPAWYLNRHHRSYSDSPQSVASSPRSPRRRPRPHKDTPRPIMPKRSSTAHRRYKGSTHLAAVKEFQGPPVEEEGQPTPTTEHKLAETRSPRVKARNRWRIITSPKGRNRQEEWEDRQEDRIRQAG